MKTSQIAIFAFLALAIGGAVWYFFLRSVKKFPTLRGAFNYWIDNKAKNDSFRIHQYYWFNVMTGNREPKNDKDVELYNAEKASWDAFRKQAGF